MSWENIRNDVIENSDNFPVGLRVLVVDADLICLQMLEAMLRNCQYHVTTISQARIALKMLWEDRDRFDVVISNVHMLDMDGFRFLEVVGLEMNLPIVMLSRNIDPKLILKGVTHGACDYLLKSVRIEELRNIWQHVIRRNMLDRCWSVELHRKFVATVNQVGIDKAVPRKIHGLMNVEGLTREDVASHLQKYRLCLRKMYRNTFTDPGAAQGGGSNMQQSPHLSTDSFHNQLVAPLLSKNMDLEKGLFNKCLLTTECEEKVLIPLLSTRRSSKENDENWESGCWMKARNQLQTLNIINVSSKLIMFLALSCFCLFIAFLVFYGFSPTLG